MEPINVRDIKKKRSHWRVNLFSNSKSLRQDIYRSKYDFCLQVPSSKTKIWKNKTNNKKF
jgi:hypothetical protein